MPSTADFHTLTRSFRENDFPTIEAHPYGARFLKLRSMSRKATAEKFMDSVGISYKGMKSSEYLLYLFNHQLATDSHVETFIANEYKIEREERLGSQDYLVDQLNRLKHFDWGGSY